jgi:hypothetical protein
VITALDHSQRSPASLNWQAATGADTIFAVATLGIEISAMKTERRMIAQTRFGLFERTRPRSLMSDKNSTRQTVGAPKSSVRTRRIYRDTKEAILP